MCQNLKESVNGMYVRDYMTANPYSVAPDATISDAMELMREHSVSRLPVLKDGKLVGLVTDGMLLEVTPSKATSLSVFEVNYLLAKTRINSIMVKQVATISPDALVEEAALLMRESNLGGLPVLEKDKVIGIITETDIFNAFINIMGFRDKGSRIAVVYTEDKPGVLADITTIIAGFNMSITHLVVHKSEIICRVNSHNVDAVVEALKAKGYNVISVRKNN